MTAHVPWPIGRSAEVDRLVALAQEASGTSSGRLACLTGVAGMDGDQVLEALRERLSDRGWATPPVVQALAWEQGRQGGVLDELCHRLGGRAHLTGWSEQRARPEEVQRQVVALHAALAPTGGPVLLGLAGGAHADVLSLQALVSAARRPPVPLLVVVLVTVAEHEALPSPLAGADVRRLVLPPLRSADVREIALRQYGVSLSATAARRLRDHTGGLPGAVHELLEQVPAGVLQSSTTELPAPRSHRAAIESALGALTPAARDLVCATAVLGHGCSLAEAVAVGRIEAPVPALTSAIDAGLLVVLTRENPVRLGLPSPLDGPAVLDILPMDARLELHARAADVVADEWARLHHRFRATALPGPEVVGRLDAFARRRAKEGVWSEASDAWLLTSRVTTDPVMAADRLLAAVDAVLGAGQVPEALALLPELEALDSAGALAARGYLATLRGRAAEAGALLESAWERVGDDRVLAATVAQRRVIHALGQWRGQDLVTWAWRGMDLAAREDPAWSESAAVVGLGLAMGGRGGEALAEYDALARIGLPPAQHQRALMGHGWVLLARDQPEQARRLLEESLSARPGQGSTRITLWAHGWLARAHLALGDAEEAARVVDAGLALLERSGIELVAPLLHWAGTTSAVLLGQDEAASWHLRGLGERMTGYPVMTVPAALARAEVAEAANAHAAVLDALAPLATGALPADVDEPGFWPWQHLWASALVGTGRLDEADAFLRPHEALAADRGHLSQSARLAIARGRLQAARGEARQAAERMAEAVESLATLPLPVEQGRAQFALGVVLRRAGSRRDADAALRRARELFDGLGAVRLTAQADRELRAGGVATTRAIDRTLLTPQEQAVARLVVRGLGNREVAEQLYVSVKTVQFHLTNIYGKLRVSSRTALASEHPELAED